MEAKKNPQADLEKRKGLLFQLGIVLALALVLVAFEWAQFERTNSELGKLNVELEEEEMIPITQQTPPPPPPPPPPPQTIVLEIVEDDEEVEEDLELDTEADEDTEVEIVEVEEEEAIVEDEIFTFVEEQPTFPGGEAKMREYLAKNTKFPPMAKDAGIQGIVYLTFVVNKKGEISDVRILRGIGGGCDEEAIRVVKGMPNWNPGKQRGRPVSVQFNLPMRFILRGG
ncbi:MAG: energy transducer TonB [Crocinitomicaceae bacterium]|nr:energy transducer TonB [Crocinitomicaceae bacterium]